MINTLKIIIKSNAFLLSLVSIILYLIIFYKEIVIDSNLITYIFYYFIGLLPIVISVFAILISFTDKKFLNYLLEHTIENGQTKIYDATIHYFKLNTYLIVFSLITTCAIVLFSLHDFLLFSFPIFQYILLFILVYTTVSFVNVIRFIFYFAGRKSDWLEDENKIE